jgi:superfamily II DNA or RNA helicase
MVLADLMHEFDPATRGRAGVYYRGGAVRILAHSSEVIRARVRGSETYGVKLHMTDHGVLRLSCTCPFFYDRGACKHLWATVLTAHDRGILAQMPKPARVQLADQVDDFDDPLDDELDDEVEAAARSLLRAGGAMTPAAPLRGGRPAAIERPPLWQQLLDHAKSQTPPLVTARRTAAREILYVVDIERTKAGELTLLVMERPLRKDGGWGKEKPVRVPIDELPLLPDERDRKILPLLQTANTLGGSYGYYGYGVPAFPSEVRVPPGMAAMLMPLIADTGRLRVRTGPGEIVAASYESDPPFQFTLVVERDPGEPFTDVVGQLRRNGEAVDLMAPIVLTRSGWAVFADRLSRFEHFDALGLVVTLREHHRIRVPRAQEEQLLAKLLGLPALPRLVLLESLALREIEVRPQPVLRLGPPDPHSRPHAASGNAVGDIAFDYEGELLPASDARAIVARIPERTLIRRDRAAEKGAAAKLAEVGFRLQQPARGWQDERAVFEIAPKKVPHAVRALLAEGWRVEADGKLYRRPGQVRIEVTSGIDWFDLSATVDFDGVRAALPDLLRALRRGENAVLLGDGSLGVLPEEWLAKYGLLGELGTAEGDTLRFRRSQAGILDAALLAAGAEGESRVDDVFARARAELATFDGVAPEDAPPGFRGELRPYQKVGVGWMAFLRRFGFGGCLADDMGLGKTVQLLAMLAARRGQAGAPSLVIVPKSLVWNWKQEAARFAPKLRVLAHVGPDRASEPAALARADLVLTTYGTLRNDVMLLRDIEFDYVVLDEAQAIKNADSESAKAARLLRARHRLALSGTPIENHIGELWSLFEFLNPGMLGTARVFQGAAGTARPKPETIALLARALRPFILRRTKDAVAPELPPKHEETILCELESGQRRLYQELRDHYRESLLGRIERQGLGKVKLQVLEALLRLRQAACHPALIDRKRAKEPCAKLEVLLPRLLEVRQEGHKALVFSQFTSFLALVRAALDAAGVSYEYLDGKTEDRERRVARFQTDPDCGVFLVSLKAGGVGLNLTAAEYVFILDPWWNPAVEAQAVDRAHRIGQSNRVFVYRLLAKDTVEEKVAALQESKRGLAESIINGGNSLIRELDRETFEALLS